MWCIRRLDLFKNERRTVFIKYKKVDLPQGKYKLVSNSEYKCKKILTTFSRRGWLETNSFLPTKFIDQHYVHN